MRGVSVHEDEYLAEGGGGTGEYVPRTGIESGGN